jgi:hypothetical protein
MVSVAPSQDRGSHPGGKASKGDRSPEGTPAARVVVPTTGDTSGRIPQALAVGGSNSRGRATPISQDYP